MFGWEFPPQISGGLGVACEGLVRGLLQTGTEVVLVLPRHPAHKRTGRLRIVESLRDAQALPEPSRGAAAPAPRRTPTGEAVRRIETPLRPYPDLEPPESPRAVAVAPRTAEAPLRAAEDSNYGPNLASEVLLYAQRAGEIALRERFDVIHSHDWMTLLAGMEARRISGRPLVAHVHATERDRSGAEGNAFVRDIERTGLNAADRVIAVSRYTARQVARDYGVPLERIRVVHNAVDPGDRIPRRRGRRQRPLVLFAGRITRQKGPGYFLEAAARVVREIPGVRFAVAGTGDLLPAMREGVEALGLRRNLVFTGFLPPRDLDRLYASADVYVMPSLSEPFGLTALEALRHGTPAIVSRSAGVSEVVRNVLRVDFGDVDDLASKILSVLLFAPLRRSLSSRGRREVLRLSWKESAESCLAVYRELLGIPARRRSGSRRGVESRLPA